MTTINNCTVHHHWRGHNFHVGIMRDDVYKMDISLLWPCNDENYRTYMLEMYGNGDQSFEGDAGRCTQISIDGNPIGYLISLYRWKNNPLWNGVLAHECLHATCFIMRDHSIDMREDSGEEAACLLHESLVRRCLDMLRLPHAKRTRSKTEARRKKTRTHRKKA